MAETITWLHISDTHLCKEKNSWSSSGVFEQFFIDLENMEKEHGLVPDLIFFTGDIAMGHIGNSPGLSLHDQYEEAQKFIEKICNIFSESVPKSNVFIIPGNHDINCNKVLPEQKQWLDGLHEGKMERNPAEIVNELIKNKGMRWEYYMKRLEDYKLFLQEGGYGHLLKDSERLTYSKTCQVNGYIVGISGLNSVWSSSCDEKKGNLWLGTYQILEAHNSIRDALVSISLIHHPPNWFTKFEESDIKKNIERLFKLCLHGHEHDNWVTPTDQHIRIASGALYNGHGNENGYNFVRLYPRENRGEVFLRRYDKDGGGWIPRIIKGKTSNDGIMEIKNLNFEIDKTENTSGAKKITIPKTHEVREEIVRLPHYMSSSDLGPEFLDQIKSVQLDENLFSYLKTIVSISFNERITTFSSKTYGPKDIRIISIKNEQIPKIAIEEKTPSLQELKTQEQVNKHFIPLPRVTSRLNLWISNGKDLLFQGLPFCGKTSLMTYLACECTKLDGKLQPIRIEPPKDLSIEDVPASVSRLLQSFRQEKIFEHSKRPILILENVHIPSHFEIVKMLMNQKGRIWRVWATSRPRELSKMLETESNLQENFHTINDACDLLRDEDIGYIFKTIIKPKLISQGLETEEIDNIRQTIRSRGNVPFRFLVKIIDIISSSTVQPIEGYASLFAREPTGTEEIVRSLWPVDNRYSQEALFTACYLPNPSWEILRKILDGMNEKSGEGILNELRSSLALVNDSDDPERVTMYDPVSERIESGDFITASLKARIWVEIESILSESQLLEKYSKSSYYMWMDIGRLALKENNIEVGAKLFELAIYKSDGLEKIDALSNFADCIIDKPNPDWDGAITAFQEAADLLKETEQKEELANVLNNLAYCLYHKIEPDWNGAITAFQEAANLLKEAEQKEDLANVLNNLAYCLYHKPDPDWNGAITVLQETADLLENTEQKDNRASALNNLAYCLYHKPDPDWDFAVKTFQKAADLLKEIGQNEDYANVLYNLAYCLRRKPDPDWDGAITALQERTDLLRTTEQKEVSVDALRALAYFSRRKPDPDWDGAITALQEAADLLKETEQKEELANVLNNLAYCLYHKIEPDWNGAIKAFQEAANLLKEAEQKEDLANVLNNLAYCLCHKPDPDWDSAITAFQEAADLLENTEQKDNRASVFKDLAYCLCHKPDPDWDSAITVLQEAADLLENTEQKGNRASVFKGLAYCLLHKPDPDWNDAITAFQEAADLLENTEQKGNLVSVFNGLAYCLYHKPDPDWDGAITALQKAADLLDESENENTLVSLLNTVGYWLHRKPNPDWINSINRFQRSFDIKRVSNSILGLIICYDAIEEYEKADNWAKKLQDPSFKVQLYKNTPEFKIYQDAYLYLRSGNNEKAMELANSLKESSENSRAMLISSILYYKNGKENEFLRCLSDSSANLNDKLWVKSVAIGFFKRFNISGIEKFLQELMEER